MASFRMSARSVADNDAISWADNDDAGSSSSSSTSFFRRHLKLIALIVLIVAVLIGVIVVVVLVVPVSTTQQNSTNNDSVTGAWGKWSQCSTTCDGGLQNRTRTCQTHRQMKSCIGNTTETRLCNQEPCTVNGSWTEWTALSICSETCGVGLKTRNRSCINPAPANGGLPCSGPSRENYTCNVAVCPVNGAWTDWTPWSICSVTCGDGISTRNRSCDNPAPANGGIHCSGQRYETETCNEANCPVNGGWGGWIHTTYCCGGKRRRYRACNKPRPAYGGAVCIGDNVDSMNCPGNDCPADCSWYTGLGLEDGVYHILANMKHVPVFCEFSSDGAWTVLQRRFDGSEDFYRSWREYKEGFGNTTGEYWLGNDAIHAITSPGNYKLTVRLMDWDNVTKFANYSTFQIADESESYRLSISGYSGDAVDDMDHNNGKMFSTVDKDNDQWSDINCAERYRGAWWYWGYSWCGTSNLNGVYHQSARAPDITGIFWYHWHGGQYSLKATTMMIQRH